MLHRSACLGTAKVSVFRLPSFSARDSDLGPIRNNTVHSSWTADDDVILTSIASFSRVIFEKKARGSQIRDSIPARAELYSFSDSSWSHWAAASPADEARKDASILGNGPGGAMLCEVSCKRS